MCDYHVRTACISQPCDRNSVQSRQLREHVTLQEVFGTEKLAEVRKLIRKAPQYQLKVSINVILLLLILWQCSYLCVSLIGVLCCLVLRFQQFSTANELQIHAQWTGLVQPVHVSIYKVEQQRVDAPHAAARCA